MPQDTAGQPFFATMQTGKAPDWMKSMLEVYVLLKDITEDEYKLAHTVDQDALVTLCSTLLIGAMAALADKDEQSAIDIIHATAQAIYSLGYKRGKSK